MTNSDTQSFWRDLYPFDSHWHQVEGGRIHYIDEGEGRPVVMFHGNPTWSFMYRNLVKAIVETGGRAIAIDNMGCGLSDKPQTYPYRLENHVNNAESLLESLGLSEMDIVVHDWGGAIGFGYAVRHPQKIRRMVAFNTAAFIVNRCPKRIRMCRIPIFGDIAVRAFNGFARAALVHATAHPAKLSDAVKQGFLAPYDSYANRIATLRFVQDIPFTSKHPTWKTITTIEKGLGSLVDKPFLLCWGMKDFCFTPEFLDRWLAYFPDALVKRFPDDGHYLLEDAGDTVIDSIAEFLK